MESRTDTGRLIQPADANGQQVSIADIEVDAPSSAKPSRFAAVIDVDKEGGVQCQKSASRPFCETWRNVK
jgi:hypothetical protein